MLFLNIKPSRFNKHCMLHYRFSSYTRLHRPRMRGVCTLLLHHPQKRCNMQQALIHIHAFAGFFFCGVGFSYCSTLPCLLDAHHSIILTPTVCRNSDMHCYSLMQSLEFARPSPTFASNQQHSATNSRCIGHSHIYA